MPQDNVNNFLADLKAVYDRASQNLSKPEMAQLRYQMRNMLNNPERFSEIASPNSTSKVKEPLLLPEEIEALLSDDRVDAPSEELTPD